MKKTLPAWIIFLGSFLLFGVQPMLGRTLLPSFGGTATVWTVCLASYQTLLLIGYFYAHLIRKRPVRQQQQLHRALLIVSVIWTAAFAFARPLLKPLIGNGSQPALEVLFCVLLCAGLPYVLLSANSTLIQSWLTAHSDSATAGTDSRAVYRLYGLSNLGSLLGLVVYPFILEPYVSLSAQWWGFTAGLAAYTALIWRLGAGAPALSDRSDKSDASDLSDSSDSSAHAWLWFVLPGVSVFLLNAVTAHLTLDVMPLPLLWVVLLALFLLSYVIGFSSWSPRLLPFLPAVTVLSVAGIALTYRNTGPDGGFALNLAASLVLCLVGCTFIHAWLYSLRPNTRLLTRYYLGNAAGGAVGGLAASLLMPLVANTVAEFPIAVVLVALAVPLYGFTRNAHKPVNAYALVHTLLAAAALAGLAFAFQPRKDDRPVVRYARGFFGTLQVLEAKARSAQGEGVIHEFVHGNTVHGIQALIPGMERMPTTYFTPQNGGYAILGHPKYRAGEPLRVNILGLGVGVMLAYARTNDFYRCYEISPEALRIASDPSLFTFVSGCPASLDVRLQDARKGLESELAADEEPYDVIQIDAFTGDNLPYHLSTREAFELYFKMLKPDGILAVNISNWHLGLEPFIKAAGDAFACPVVVIASRNDYARLSFAAKFAFFCRTPEKLGPLPEGAMVLNLAQAKPFTLPVDEKGSFVKLINW
ncbi:MAG: spermidine synthase [Kiritimatiellia bacterium]|jgi:hypothetical protein